MMPPANLLRSMSEGEIAMGQALYNFPIPATSRRVWSAITWDAMHVQDPQISERAAALLRTWVRARRDRLPAEVVAHAEEPEAPAKGVAGTAGTLLAIEGDVRVLLAAYARVRTGRTYGFWLRLQRDVQAWMANVEAGEARRISTLQMSCVHDALWRHRTQLSAGVLAVLPRVRAEVFARVTRPFDLSELREAVHVHVLGRRVDAERADAVVEIWRRTGVIKRTEESQIP